MGPMPLFRQSSAAAVLVTLTLSVQSAGMARLIHWGRAHVKRGLHKLGPLLSAGFLFAIVTRLVEHESQMVPAQTKRPAVLSIPEPF